MAILCINTNSPGMTAVTPRFIYIDTNDTVATITTVGYLNDSVKKFGIQLNEHDLAVVSTRATPASKDFTAGIYEVTQVGTDWSLVSTAAPGSAILPTVGNAMAYFEGTTGIIKSGDDSVTHAGSLWLNGGSSKNLFVDGDISCGGIMECVGGIQVDAAPDGNGGLTIQSEVHGSDLNNFLVLQLMPLSTQFNLWYPGTVDCSILINPLRHADANSNTIYFDVTVSQADLASAGSKVLFSSDTAKQYKIRELYINSGGTNFSGGGGDRLATISDGTTDYSVIPAASLQTLVNGRWGDTTLAFPASAAINTSTVAASDLTIAYSGGTTDYTAGSVVISGVLERVV